jgi:hypothetical protein
VFIVEPSPREALMKKRYRLGFVFAVFTLLLAIQPVFAGWVEDGTVICDADGEQTYVSSVPDGAGGAIVVWEDHRAIWSVIYAQRVNANGDALWPGNGITVSTSISKQQHPAAVSDGSGGVIVAWIDYRNGTTNADIFAQRLNADGNRVWLATGVPVCRAVYDQDWPCIVPDGAGGAIIGWEDYRLVDGSSDIYAQRVDAGGVVMWAENGIPVCTSGLFQRYPVAASDGSGGTFLAWNDLRNGNVEIYVQKIDASGVARWSPDGVTFFSAIEEQWLRVVPDTSGGVIVCWTDLRGGNMDIFAQHVDESGAVAWDYNGVAVCNLGGNEYQPSMIPDGAGGAIVAWTNGSIYAQRVAGNGCRLWPSAGVRMGTGTYIQRDCVLVGDGAGGAVVAWDDGEIFAQRVSSDGAVMWKEEGVPLCTETVFAYYPSIAADGSGGAIVAWEDWRHTLYEADLYALRVDAAGNTISATLLQSYTAALTGDGIRIEWKLSEIDRDVSFIVLRSAGDPGAFEEIVSTGIAREGLSFSFIDTEWDAGATYWYRVDVCIGAERRELFRTGPVATPSLPLTLHQNSPNPFNPSTVIRFYLPERCVMSLDVYDASGRLVKRLAAQNCEKGMHSVLWDGRDAAGRAAGSGIYFARLRAGKEVQSRKMILLR